WISIVMPSQVYPQFCFQAEHGFVFLGHDVFDRDFGVCVNSIVIVLDSFGQGILMQLQVGIIRIKSLVIGSERKWSDGIDGMLGSRLKRFESALGIGIQCSLGFNEV